MALQLDLEEQEQFDEFKHFWSRWGDYIVWALIVVLGAYAAWSGWHYWQRRQATQSAVLFETVEHAAEAADLVLMERSFGDLKDKFGSTTYSNQAAFEVAKTFYEKGQSQKAEEILSWVIKTPIEPGYEALAKLRLSALLTERGAFGEARTALGGSTVPEFNALFEDRLGDIDLLEKDPESAKAHFTKAWTAMDARAPYRRFLEAKLNSLGVDPTATGKSTETSAKLSSSTDAPTPSNKKSADPKDPS